MTAQQSSGVTVAVVLANSSGSFNCGDLVTGVVRVTNNLQYPVQLYPSSDSVKAWASVTLPTGQGGYQYASDSTSIGQGDVIQPGSTNSYTFYVRLYSDPAIYRDVISAAVEARTYHSTSYNPTDIPAFSNFAYDSGQSQVSITCTGSSTTSTTSSNQATTDTGSSSIYTTYYGTGTSGDVPAFPFAPATVVSLMTVVIVAYLMVRTKARRPRKD
jgi:hypothetical protein